MLLLNKDGAYKIGFVIGLVVHVIANSSQHDTCLLAAQVRFD